MPGPNYLSGGDTRHFPTPPRRSLVDEIGLNNPDRLIGKRAQVRERVIQVRLHRDTEPLCQRAYVLIERRGRNPGPAAGGIVRTA
jgi:hypothetical protein